MMETAEGRLRTETSFRMNLGGGSVGGLSVIICCWV